MKKYFLLLILSLFMVACSGNSPKSVASDFLTALNKGDIDEAKKYCDGPTADLLNLMGRLAENRIKEEAKGGKFTITKVEEDGDTARVYYTMDQEEKGRALDLKKIDGKWKVTIKKEDTKKQEKLNENSSEEVEEAAKTVEE